MSFLALVLWLAADRAPELLRDAATANGKGDYETALAKAREAAAICHDPACEARAHNHAGLALLYRGEYAAALPEFESSLALLRRTGDRENEIYRLNNIGNVYYFQGRYMDALRSYRAAEEVVKATATQPWNVEAHRFTVANLAALYQRLGRDEFALNLYRSLRSSAARLSPSEEARLLANFGVLYRRLGDPVKALQTYREAERLFASERHPDGEIGTLKNIGIAEALDFGDYAAARRAFTEALRLALKSGNAREAMQAHLYLGEVRFRSGETDAAAREWEASLAAARTAGTAEEEWKSLYGLGEVAARHGDRTAARERFESAAALVESVRSRLQSASLKPGFLAEKRDVYDALLDVLPTGALDAALDCMERARARTLEDRLQAGALPDSLRRLRARISELYARRLRAPGPGLDADIASLETDYIAAEHETRPAAGASRPSLDSLASRLEPDTAVLFYWAGRSNLTVLWVTREGAGMAVRPAAGLEERVRATVEALSRPSSESWRAAAAPLAAQLLDGIPPLARPGTRRLIVVPDGPLLALPFEVLPFAGAPAIERFEISYSPSARLLARDAQAAAPPRSGPWSRQLLAFGDPVDGRAARENSVIPGDEQWLRLPRSAEEVRAIARLLPGRTEVRLGAAARKDRFLASLQNPPPLLHLATHAAADEEDPARSRILFSGAPYDYLFLDEIYALDLRGVSLATLSACQTERGRIVRGDGVQSLGRAFLAAGARSTVTTLWSVADAPAAELMKQFYYFLARGHGKAAALRLAKLKFLHSGAEFAHPAQWAAFVLNGDGLAPVPPVAGWPPLLAGAAALLAAAGAGAAFRLRR